MITVSRPRSGLLQRAQEALQQVWWRPSAEANLGIRLILVPLSWLYRVLAAGHRLWARPASPPRRPVPVAASLNHQDKHSIHVLAPVPTVVVGNWVVGGAGKTPTTMALLAYLQGRGWTPGLVSRGYGRSGLTVQRVDPLVHTAQEVGDEPLLMARRSGVPVVVGRDRQRAREWLLHTAPEVDIVVSDDGLQHHRLWRDLEVVVVDERGAGNGWCLPAGPLREPLPQRLSARTLVLYSSGSATLELPGYRAQRQLCGLQRLQDWLQGRPCTTEGGWRELQGRSVHAAAGIAVPERFFAALRQQGLSLAHTHALPDHDAWDSVPWPAHAGDVVVTEKDAVKLAASHAAHFGTRVWVARLDLVLPTDFIADLDRRLQALRPPHSATV